MMLLSMMAGRPWAITPAGANALVRLAERLPTGTEALALHGAGAHELLGPDSVALRLGQPLEGTRSATVRDGVAIIAIDGPIFPKADLLTEMSGATALSRVGADLQSAFDNPAVNSILLDIDSPGGAVSGVADIAASVRAMRGGAKPIIAFTQGMAASAAYWIASATDAIVMAPAAEVGSIGVVALAEHQVEPDRDGYRQREIVSSNAPSKRPDVGSDDGVSEIRARLDDIEQVFIADVAVGRGVNAATVRDTFGRGGMVGGPDAIMLGMADRIMTFESLMAELADGRFKTTRGAIGNAPISKEAGMAESKTTPITGEANAPAPAPIPAPITLDTLRARHPEMVAALKHEGYAEGATTERTRFLGILEHARGLKGHDALVAKMLADPRVSPDAAAALLLEAEKQKGGKLLAELQGLEPEAGNAPKSTPMPAPAPPKADDPNLSIDERAKAAWDSDRTLRAEFASYGDYLAFRKAEAAGRVRRLTGKNAA